MIKNFLFKSYISLINAVSGKGLNKILPTKKIYFLISQLLKPEKIKVQDHYFFIDQKKSGTYLAHHFIAKKEYEPITTKVFEYFLQPGMFVVDVGAHLGYFTMLSAKLVGKNGKVFAFEPEPHIYSLLKKNIELNRYKNISAIQQAVTNKESSTSLYLSNESSGSNSIYPGEHYDEITQIPTIRLDKFFYKNLTKIDLIKMDIEGAEPFALEGMHKIILKNKKLILITEFNPMAIHKGGNDPIKFLNNLNLYFHTLYAIDEIGKKIFAIKNIIFFKKMLGINNFWNNIVCIKGYLPNEINRFKKIYENND